MVEFTRIRQGYLTGTGTPDYHNAGNANVKNESEEIILIYRAK